MARTTLIDQPTLDPALRAAWTALRAGNPVLASPYFAPEFYEAVASVTRTGRLIVAEDDKGVAALMPLQKRVGGSFGPIGGPLNDLHGAILRDGAGLDPADLLEQTGVPMVSLNHAPLGRMALGARFGAAHAFHVMNLEDGYAAYESRRLPFAKSAFRAIRTRTDKARGAFGDVTMVFDDRSPRTLETLIAWKREQYRATGQPILFDIPWVRELTDRLHTSRDPELRGQLSALYFGDELVAAHFGLRGPKVLHYWFPGYAPAHAELSPGNLLLKLMAEAAAAEGCTALHLGAGDYRYKHEFADCCFPVTDGVAFARSFAGRTAAAAGLALAELTKKLPEPLAALPGKAMRRIDKHLAFRAA